MKRLRSLSDRQFLFGSVFVAANRTDTLLGREFKAFDITTKQWFLSIVIDNMFDAAPTIKEVAQAMGSSHQNVKQIALKLQEKGLLILEKDKDDARAIRLRLTERSIIFWRKLRDEGAAFTQNLFRGIDEKDLNVARRTMEKILANIETMDRGE